MRLLRLRLAMTGKIKSVIARVIARSNLCSIFLFFALFTSFTADASAEDYVNTQTYVHSFSNNINVFTAVFALNRDITLDTSTYFRYTVDAIGAKLGEDEDRKGGSKTTAVSGASTAAGGVKDTRNEITAGITHNLSSIVGIEAYYDFSKESDYTSHTPSLALKKDLFEKNTAITMGYSRNMDRVYGKYMSGEKGRDTDNYFFGVTQVLSPVTVAQLGYSRSDISGFTSDGVRLVPLNGASSSSCTDRSAACVDESFPDFRKRDAIIFGINQYFPRSIVDRSSLKFTYRYYTDDWNIASNTGEVEYNEYIDRDTIFRVNFRYYEQSKANFIGDIYTGGDKYKSSSPQFLGFNSQLMGLKISSAVMRSGSVEGKLEYYSQSINLNALVFMLSARFAF